MNGIKKSDCTFYVDEEKRTVVCVYQTNPMVVRDIVWDLDEGAYVKVITNNKMWRQLEMPKSFCGKAVCSPDDTWNEETGMNIAFYRMKEKYYTSFFKRANRFVNEVSEQLNKYIDTFNRIGVSVQRRQEDLASILPDEV
jgi:hypothetical protein